MPDPIWIFVVPDPDSAKKSDQDPDKRTRIRNTTIKVRRRRQIKERVQPMSRLCKLPVGSTTWEEGSITVLKENRITELGEGPVTFDMRVNPRIEKKGQSRIDESTGTQEPVSNSRFGTVPVTNSR